MNMIHDQEGDRPTTDVTEEITGQHPLSFRAVSIATGLLVLLVGFFAPPGSAITNVEPDPVSQTAGLRPSTLIEGHRDIRDTLFTTDSVWLDVDLERQVVTVRKRDGEARQFLISSGNPYIREGMATPAGIYTVQNKVPLAISRQFNDARLHNWIGVYGGVGFHGLDGTGYYGNLGVRPSSHGCIRMARDEIKMMYQMVHVGAPILVRNGEPARVVAFRDPADTIGADLIDSVRARARGLGTERIEALYAGRLLQEDLPPLVHTAGTRVDWRIESGRKGSIPRQIIPRTLTLPPTSREISNFK
jgi:lipoprotein-anchoring transpeptidase ErfK/SrfK